MDIFPIIVGRLGVFEILVFLVLIIRKISKAFKKIKNHGGSYNE